MRAIAKLSPEPGLQMIDVPVPTPGINDVLIKIKQTSICGTDVHIYNWDSWAQKTIKPPMVIGHEFVGIGGHEFGQLLQSPRCAHHGLHFNPVPQQHDVNESGQLPKEHLARQPEDDCAAVKIRRRHGN